MFATDRVRLRPPTPDDAAARYLAAPRGSRPGVRGRGDQAAVPVWIRNRNLRRLELETLASNTAMRRTAEACGFTHEGTQRERGCDGDGFADMVIYGLLRREWTP
jgi:hypothetical protein